jgi:hypothetical protein
MTNDSKYDFLFAFQTLLLADISKNPCSLDHAEIQGKVTKALRITESFGDELTKQQLVVLATDLVDE